MARCGECPESDAARIRHGQAEARVATALANVELLAAGIPEARRKAELLGSLAAAEEEERRLQALLDAEAETSEGAPHTQELRDAEEQAGFAEQHLTDMRARAAATSSQQAELSARAERALGELEASQRQTFGLDPEATRLALAEVETIPEVSDKEIRNAELELETANAALTGPPQSDPKPPLRHAYPSTGLTGSHCRSEAHDPQQRIRRKNQPRDEGQGKAQKDASDQQC